MSDATTNETTEAPEVDEERQAVLDALTEALGDALIESHIRPGQGLWVRVDRDAWRTAHEVAKLRLGCTFFDFVSGLDWQPAPWGRYEDSAIDTGIVQFDHDAPFTTGLAGGDTRFQVFSRVVNVRKHHDILFKADLPADDLRVASLVPLYAGADWHERECWEMFGFTFDEHPGLRHLYLPGEFEGHPLRKDFPLLARMVKPWPGIVDVEPMPEETASPDEADDTAQGGDT